MIRLVSILILVGALPLAGCGGGDETTVTETTTVDTAAEETTGEETTGGTLTEAASGPEGTLSGSAIGTVSVGDDSDAVEDEFGVPDEEMQVPGCELSGDSQPTRAWVWHLDEGDVTVQFDAADRLRSYRTTSPELTTTFGSRVGESFTALRKEYGSALEPLDLGAASTPQTGFWYIGADDLDGAILFSITGGNLDSISGGSIEICE